MRSIFLAWVWLALSAFLPRAMAVPSEAAGTRLVVELSDGSRIIGVCSLDRFAMTTQYAQLDVPFSLLSLVEFGAPDHAARARFQNGDLLTCHIAAERITLNTLFGEAAIPMAEIRRIRVARAGGESLPEGLILHLGFQVDEGGRVTDTSASGSHGKVLGAVHTSDGKGGGAMGFGGDREAVVVGNPANLRIQDFTIMARIKRSSPEKTSKREAVDGVLFGYGRFGYVLGIHRDGRLFLSKVDVNNVMSTCAINDDAFHQVAVTKQADKVVFYLDGIAYPGPDYDPGFEFGTDAAVGNRADSLNSGFLGLIEDVSVFNRALSGDEVRVTFDSYK